MLRMMQNDRDEYADGMSRYLSRMSNPINYVDWDGRQATTTSAPATQPTTQPSPVSTQKLNLEVIKWPKGALCGDFADDGGWIIQWKLSEPSPKGGWIIQRIETTVDVKDCKGNVVRNHPLIPQNGKIIYWETWRVNAGQKITIRIGEYILSRL